jgi:hypothetical protein
MEGNTVCVRTDVKDKQIVAPLLAVVPAKEEQLVAVSHQGVTDTNVRIVLGLLARRGVELAH